MIQKAFVHILYLTMAVQLGSLLVITLEQISSLGKTALEQRN